MNPSIDKFNSEVKCPHCPHPAHTGLCERLVFGDMSMSRETPTGMTPCECTSTSVSAAEEARSINVNALLGTHHE